MIKITVWMYRNEYLVSIAENTDINFIPNSAAVVFLKNNICYSLKTSKAFLQHKR